VGVYDGHRVEASCDSSEDEAVAGVPLGAWQGFAEVVETDEPEGFVLFQEGQPSG
jgi:hypothetical protein